MPINVGRRGMPAVLANPALRRRLGRSNNRGGDQTFLGGSLAFRSPPFTATNPYLEGVTLDSGSTPVGSCTVQLFRTADDAFIAETISDAVTGAYAFTVLVGGPFYVVAYKAGAPDIFGTTVNTLTPTAVR